MDSLTQIVLGAAVGEAAIGKKVGNWAILWGAVAGTIPDLDVLALHFTDNITALEIHRGFTHSLFFSVFFAPIFGFIISKIHRKLNVTWKDWTLLMFLGFFTHGLLDAHTTWGTQLFWPLDYRLAYKNIFVIDPLYTIPFLFFVILAMCYKKENKKRSKYNNLGLIVSSSYMVLTLGFKWIGHQQFTTALAKQEIDYQAIATRPTPLNAILWGANVQLKDAYIIGYYSLFDKSDIQFSEKIPKNQHLLKEVLHEKKVQQLIKITEGWYAVEQSSDRLIFKDLRFGQNDINNIKSNFVFSFELFYDENGEFQAIEQTKEIRDGKLLLKVLFTRINGI